jgi:hypothetical protein
MKDSFEHNCFARFIRIYMANVTGDGSNRAVQHLRGADKELEGQASNGKVVDLSVPRMVQREQLSFSLRGITRHKNWVVYARRTLLFLSIVLEDLLELFAHAFEIFMEGG